MVTKAQVIELLQTNDKAIARALVALRERQTADEKIGEQTRHDNGRGFAPCDARMGTSMATFYLRFNRLSEKQLAYWKRTNAKGVMRICKYAGQLVEIAAEKAAAKVEKSEYNSDAGNLLEEKMILEEMYQEAGEQCDEGRAERIAQRIMQINEHLEEIARCEYKMNRDFALAA